MAEYLRSIGLSAPEIYAKDIENGLLLLEDLKVDSYSLIMAGAALLSDNKKVECKLYMEAIRAITKLQNASLPEIPLYDKPLLTREISLLPDWYLRHKGIVVSQQQSNNYYAIWDSIISKIHYKQDVVVHRDYHADNLIWMPTRESYKRVGIIDFQDAVIGSPAYDLVSLLQDARRDVEPKIEKYILEGYFETNPEIDREKFMDDYYILGAQRNCKILGIFARLSLRDHKPKYLQMTPRVWRYIERNLDHPYMEELRVWLDEVIPKNLRDEVKKCQLSVNIGQHE
jgi:aminoglycoside/choline kinase family phosphotransferase